MRTFNDRNSLSSYTDHREDSLFWKRHYILSRYEWNQDVLLFTKLEVWIRMAWKVVHFPIRTLRNQDNFSRLYVKTTKHRGKERHPYLIFLFSWFLVMFQTQLLTTHIAAPITIFGNRPRFAPKCWIVIILQPDAAMQTINEWYSYVGLFKT